VSPYIVGDKEEYTSIVADQIKTAMDAECASHAMKMICNNVHRECRASVETGAMLPSSMCQSECETHKKAWDACVEKIAKDADVNQIFEGQMQALVRGFR
jgi:hypothetical protein